jgi:hypothetical protein
VYVQTPKSDIYVALLGVALGAIIISCILLFLVFKRYDMKIKAGFAPPAHSTRTTLAANTENFFSVRL